jgi:hypoxanthine phosphoribosyltransferase
VTTPPARVLYERGEVRRVVRRLAGELDERYPDGVVLVSVLKGSVIFLSDLARAVRVPAAVDFLAISTYEPDSGRVRIVKDLDTDIGGRHVVLVEDIIDTGLTVGFLLGELRRRQPASLAVCTLLDKAARRILPLPIDFVGFEVPDVFVLGYGLDFAGRYRNLELLAAGDMEVLARDPDAYVPQLYPASAPASTP